VRGCTAIKPSSWVYIKSKTECVLAKPLSKAIWWLTKIKPNAWTTCFLYLLEFRSGLDFREKYNNSSRFAQLPISVGSALYFVFC